MRGKSEGDKGYFHQSVFNNIKDYLVGEKKPKAALLYHLRHPSRAYPETDTQAVV